MAGSCFRLSYLNRCTWKNEKELVEPLCTYAHCVPEFLGRFHGVEFVLGGKFVSCLFAFSSFFFLRCAFASFAILIPFVVDVVYVTCGIFIPAYLAAAPCAYFGNERRIRYSNPGEAFLFSLK